MYFAYKLLCGEDSGHTFVHVVLTHTIMHVDFLYVSAYDISLGVGGVAYGHGTPLVKCLLSFWDLVLRRPQVTVEADT